MVSRAGGDAAVPVEPQHADRRVAQGGHRPGHGAGGDLRGVLRERPIAQSVLLVLDPPVAPHGQRRFSSGGLMHVQAGHLTDHRLGVGGPVHRHRALTRLQGVLPGPRSQGRIAAVKCPGAVDCSSPVVIHSRWKVQIPRPAPQRMPSRTQRPSSARSPGHCPGRFPGRFHRRTKCGSDWRAGVAAYGRDVRRGRVRRPDALSPFQIDGPHRQFGMGSVTGLVLPRSAPALSIFGRRPGNRPAEPERPRPPRKRHNHWIGGPDTPRGRSAAARGAEDSHDHVRHQHHQPGSHTPADGPRTPQAPEPPRNLKPTAARQPPPALAAFGRASNRPRKRRDPVRSIRSDGIS